MIKSAPILPIRIYDDLFDQQRFNIHSGKAQQLDLVYPAHQLPAFQFSRALSIQPFTSFFLRKVREEEGYAYGYYKQVPEPATIFSTYAAQNFYPSVPLIGGIYDNGVDPPSGGSFEFGKYNCNKLENVDIDPDWTISSTMGEFAIPLLIHPAKYTFKIIVDKFKRSGGSTFSLKVFTNGVAGTLLGTITAPGIYTYTFTSAAADVTLGFENYVQGDLFQISYVQATMNTFISGIGSDVALDDTKLKIVPMQNGTDIVTYCEPTQNYAPDPDLYYYVMNVNDTDFYFSEVFRIVSLKEIEKYYKLTWKNTCDINNAVIYRSSVLLCAFENVLYLDAALFNPEPETVEEGQTSGTGDFTPTLTSWQNYLTFEILKSPQFLTEALSAIILHDTITLKKPLNHHQEVNTNIFSVKRLIPEVTPVLQGCFSTVILKMLLEEFYTKTGCCTEAEILVSGGGGGGGIESYFAVEECGGEDEYTLVLSEIPAEGDGLKTCAGELVEVSEEELILFNGQYWKLTLVDGIYQPLEVLPNISSEPLSGGVYQLSGKVLPGTWAKIEFKIDADPWTEHVSVASDAEGNFAYDLLESVTTGATNFLLRVESVTIDDSFGVSDELDLI